MIRRPVLAATLLLTCTWAGAGDVRVAVLSAENYDDLAPRGKEVDAIYGDLVIRNDHVIAVIAKPSATRHANMTVRDVGGQLIDLTTPDTQSDQLSAFYVGRRRYPFRSWRVLHGWSEDRGASVVDIETLGSWTGKRAAIEVAAEPGEGRPGVTVQYRLDADSKFLEIETIYTNESRETLEVVLDDDVRIDSRNESIRFERNGLHDLFWVHDRFWGQAYGLEVEGWRTKSTTTRGVVLSYHRTGAEGVSTFGPDGGRMLRKRLYPAGNLLDVKALAAETAGEKLQPTTVTLVDGLKRPIPKALITFALEGKTYGAAVTDDGGRIQSKLPTGEYTLKVTALGVEIGEYEGEMVEPGENSIELDTFFTPGLVRGKIVDGRGRPLPAKVEFKAKGDANDPDFGPHSAAGEVGNLVYTEDGTFERAVPSGEYDVIVSHGPEYDAVFKSLKVEPGKPVDLDARLRRVVDTKGWVSADYHSHSSPSGDNTGSQLGRVYNLVCEHVEFAPCTEHNRISSYEPHIAALSIGDRMKTVSGMELTGRPLPLNHQNAFPLIHRPRTQDGGAPVTDVDVERQVERLALWDDRSRKLIQQNHPDIGWLFYDRDGNGEPDEGHSRIVPHVDVMEIHPISAIVGLGSVDERDGKPFGNNRLFNWLQMLNQGYRIRGVVNTDAHYNFHGSGGLRNWIRSSTDEPAEIDVDEMVENSEKGRIVMSNGPYVEFTLKPAGAEKPAEIGDDVEAPKGEVEVHVRVQCPNWLDVDRVYLLVNGRPSREFDFRRGEGPDVFGDTGQPVRFDESRTLKLDGDAHVIAVAVGEKSTLGDVMGPSWGKQHPAAVTNPIFVDVDGGGFTPNRDTLGSPLPVKFGTRKE